MEIIILLFAIVACVAGHTDSEDMDLWLLAIIDKYGVPIRQWARLYQVLLEVPVNKHCSSNE